MVEYIDCALREIDRNEKEDLRNFMDMAVFILNGVERIVNRNVLHGVKEEIIKQSVTEIILSLVGPPFADVNAV